MLESLCWCRAGNAEKSLKSKNSFDKKDPPRDQREGSTGHIAAQTFTFRELAAATKNFRPECLLGEGGFGRVYKGRLENTGQASERTHHQWEREWGMGSPLVCCMMGLLM